MESLTANIYASSGWICAILNLFKCSWYRLSNSI